MYLSKRAFEIEWLGSVDPWPFDLACPLTAPFVAPLDLLLAYTSGGERPRSSENVRPGFRLKRRYRRADVELRALWQVLRNMGDLNLSDVLPSKDRKGTDTATSQMVSLD